MNDRLKDHRSKEVSHLQLNLLANDGPAFDERQQNAKILRGLGVEAFLNQTDGLKNSSEALQRIVMGLDRYDNVGTGDQRADREYPEGRCAIDHTNVELVPNRGQLARQDQLPFVDERQLNFGSRQDDARRRKGELAHPCLHQSVR